ncbi:uncharacterized protein [Dysidea avara]|uniref:uncharacterized protein n=1 Tax=Dysidea avara TaxID=196820 RepID=UPI00331F02D4
MWLLLAVYISYILQGIAQPQTGFVRYHDVAGSSYTVTYDERSFLINNKRTVILSGSVHYPRSTPGMWDQIFAEMVKDGLNSVQVYVFWNLHEFKRGQDFDFSGPANLPLFLDKAAKAGLFVNLRIGPYVCAEWNYGGLPIWLNWIPGMRLRSDSAAWESEMEKFVTNFTEVLEKYLARNGGPIILAQIENEYHGSQYMDYVKWCGDLTVKLDLGIPWGMCNGLSANNTINTCNGMDCQSYAERHSQKYPAGQPLAWTEDAGWFQEWSALYIPRAYRTPEDMANAMLAWFARGGSYHNYYMWYGGNHMGRWAGSSITNHYADGVNMHSDFLPNEPKKTHLMRVHNLVAKFSDVLLNSMIQVDNPIHLMYYNNKTKQFENGTQQLAFVYNNSAGRIVFLQNSASVELMVEYNNMKFVMQPLSIIVLDRMNTILFDSSKVNSTGVRTKRVYTQVNVSMEAFSAWSESIQEFSKGITVQQHPLEQLWVTQDETDYLFYQTEVSKPISDKSNVMMKIDSRRANSLLVFVNDHFCGATDNHEHSAGDITMTVPVDLPDGDKPFNLTILSISLGLHNGISPGFIEQKGIVGKVSINEVNITTSKWLHRPGLSGERMKVFTKDGSSKVDWDSDLSKYVNTSLTWYKTSFTVKQYSTDYSLLLNLQGFGRGHYYVNGVDLGRYWLIKVDGQFVQEYYFIPPDLVNYDGPNLLVIGEELGAPDPSKATLVLSTMTM